MNLSFEDNSFDSAICTFTLCSIINPLQALKELLRVVKPGGKIVIIEHGLPQTQLQLHKISLNRYRQIMR